MRVLALCTALSALMASALEPDAGALPRGWFAAGADASNYAVDARVGACGQRAAIITSKSGVLPQGSGTVMQLFRADNYRGKRIRFSGVVSTTEVQGWVGLWARVDGPNKKALAFDNMQTRPLKGSTPCARQEVVVNVPQTAEFIAMGILLDGRGTAEVSSIALEVVDPALVASTSLIDEHHQPLAQVPPREAPAIGRIDDVWFGENTIAGYLNEVGPGLWRWKDDTQVAYDGKTVAVHQVSMMTYGNGPMVSASQGTFTLRQDGAETIIEGSWGTMIRTHPVVIRYTKDAIDMSWGFWERHLRRVDAPQLEKGCVFYGDRNTFTGLLADSMTLCGVVLNKPPVVQTIVSFLWVGFRKDQTIMWQRNDPFQRSNPLLPSHPPPAVPATRFGPD